ncbi:MAG: BNR-4 repeat-containing protein, partial [Armatimonadota bacterium]|nr:BNR-4 repeat-containing protein [Armatimonadota bacterium]
MQREFSYPQPWYFDNFGFVFLFTKYTRGRELYVSTSRDGRKWTPDRKIVGFDGHYQVSWKHGKKLGTAFNWHPKGNLNARTNLYYMETNDYGKTWVNAAGKSLKTPLDSVQNDALVHDYQKEGFLVYINDVNFDRNGNPIIFYVLSRGFESGPKNGPRTWMTARWTGERWELRRVTTCDHNYDMGSLYVEDDGVWRIIGPSDPGPQAWCTGGEMVMWVSRNQGKSWVKVRELTTNSKRNHTYARRVVDAHADFYALWADGDALRPSESHLYFASKTGKVYALPFIMKEKFEKPVVISK